MKKLILLAFIFTVSYINAYSPAQIRVTRVIDGDTLEVSLTGGTERVRLIGVDAPELNTPQGREARDFVRRLIGAYVWLESDGADRDAHGRLRRYVWLTPNMSNDANHIRRYMLNAILLENGHARFLGIRPFRHQSLFQSLPDTN